jgi:hypothetical protein
MARTKGDRKSASSKLPKSVRFNAEMTELASVLHQLENLCDSAGDGFKNVSPIIERLNNLRNAHHLAPSTLYMLYFLFTISSNFLVFNIHIEIHSPDYEIIFQYATTGVRETLKYIIEANKATKHQQQNDQKLSTSAAYSSSSSSIPSSIVASKSASLVPLAAASSTLASSSSASSSSSSSSCSSNSMSSIPVNTSSNLSPSKKRKIDDISSNITENSTNNQSTTKSSSSSSAPAATKNPPSSHAPASASKVDSTSKIADDKKQDKKQNRADSITLRMISLSEHREKIEKENKEIISELSRLHEKRMEIDGPYFLSHHHLPDFTFPSINKKLSEMVLLPPQERVQISSAFTTEDWKAFNSVYETRLRQHTNLQNVFRGKPFTVYTGVLGY